MPIFLVYCQRGFKVSPKETYGKFLLRLCAKLPRVFFVVKINKPVYCVYFAGQFLSKSVSKSQPFLTQVSEPHEAVVHPKA